MNRVPGIVILENGQLNIPLLAVLVSLLAPTIATVVSATMAQRNAKRATLAAELAVKQTDEIKESLDAHRTATAKRLDLMTGVDQVKLSNAQRRIEELEGRLLNVYETTRKPGDENGNGPEHHDQGRGQER